MAKELARTSVEADRELADIATYVCNYRIEEHAAFVAARRCLVDTLACAFVALEHPECAKLLGPIVPGAGLWNGARVPGTRYELDPATAAFNIGTLVRWLDLNDTFIGAQGSHPSDNLAGILAVADYLSRRRVRERRDPLLMRDVLEALIRAYEIQGCLAMENDFNEAGVDHVILTKVATASVVTRMLGGNPEEVLNAASNVIQNTMLRFVESGMYGQTAVECAFRLHPFVRDCLDQIDRIQIFTQRALMGVMDKTGPLHNRADRDHCVDQVHRELTLSIPPAIHADAKNRPPFSDANSLMR